MHFSTSIRRHSLPAACLSADRAGRLADSCRKTSNVRSSNNPKIPRKPPARFLVRFSLFLRLLRQKGGEDV